MAVVAIAGFRLHGESAAHSYVAGAVESACGGIDGEGAVRLEQALVVDVVFGFEIDVAQGDYLAAGVDAACGGDGDIAA